MPSGEAQLRSRYSLAFFCQANTDVMINSPRQTYPSISADDYLQQRVAANQL
jgi:isopenicillin N synthase-like dioxygenase